MPITIPDSMPEDWLIDAAIVRGCEPDDPDLRTLMQGVYRATLRRLNVANVMNTAKNDVMDAVKPTEPAPGLDPGVPAPPQPVNHELHAESVASAPDAT